MSAVYEYGRVAPRQIVEATRAAWNLKPLQTFLMITPPDSHSRRQVLRDIQNAPENTIIDWK